MKKNFFMVTCIAVIMMMAASLPVWACNEKPCDWVKQFPANILGTDNIVLYPEGDIINPDQQTLSYSGYVKVTKEQTGHDYESNMFYWFFESRNASFVKKEDKKDIPLVIWFSGGPGASSLLGCFMENGPYLAQPGGAVSFVENPNSWNEQFHMLYWDQPVGTGYSYSTPEGNYAKSPGDYGRQMVYAIQGFYDLHPEYRDCPLYITGESYGGKYVPVVAWHIVDMNKKNKDPKRQINLKRISVGDGWIDPYMHLRDEMDYAFNLGMIDTGQKKRILGVYEQFKGLRDKKEWYKAFLLGNMIPEIIVACAGNVDIYDVRAFSGLSIGPLMAYFNSDIVKKAIHVPTCVTWTFADNAGPVAGNLAKDVYDDASCYYEKLLEAKIPILCYTGNFDIACGFIGTEKILRGLKWAKKHGWAEQKCKIWAAPRVKTMGYVKYIGEQGKDKYNYRLLQVNIPGAGHLVPSNAPRASYEMLYRFIFGHEFVSYDPLDNLDEEIKKLLEEKK